MHKVGHYMKTPFREGITITGEMPKCALIEPRIFLSEGTCLSNAICNDQWYSVDAVVPRLPWRAASSCELDILANGSAFDGRWVRVLEFSTHVRRIVEELGIEARNALARGALKEGGRFTNRGNSFELVLRLISEFERCGAQILREYGGLNAGRGGCLTSTLNSRTQTYVGLHVDSIFPAKDLANRPASPPRICVNLGEEERSFIFVNLSLGEMDECLRRFEISDSRRFDTGKGLIQAFFNAFPDYPVVRIRLAPAEAYIAHTENIVHDGSTLGNRGVDITLTLFGEFSTTFRA